ncbi:MAG: SpoIIE family protein phosphatase [Candidatus Aminicenantales bacterium]
MPVLFIYPKDGDFFSYSLEKEKTSIGRAEDNEICITDPFCSNHHAAIARTESGYLIKDDASKNGTFVNGKKIRAETKLKNGDEILIGSVRIIFDKPLAADVEVTDALTSTTNVNTIIHLKEILKKPPAKTTAKASVPLFDLEKIKAEHRVVSILSEVSQALVLHKPLNELLAYIMDLICEHLPMDRGVLMLKEGNPVQLIPRVVRINNKRLQNQKIQVSQSIMNMAVEKQLAVLTSDALLDPRFSAKDSIIQSGIHSAMCVPLWNNKEIIGIIYADRISLLEPFNDDDLRLLTLLSNLAAIKIENALLIETSIEKEKMDKELQLAAQIQKDFLPKENPSCENFEIAGKNIPCYQVGGDYYDYIPIGSHRLGIAIADVSGKGVSASLLMASLRAALHSEIHARYDMEGMTARLNDFVHLSSAINSFITFFFCELNKKTGELRYVNAGHNPPLILDDAGKIQALESCGLCLGMLPSVTYKSQTAVLNSGDTALLFTDGITESRNAQNEEFSTERLIHLLRKNRGLPAQGLIEKIRSDLYSFTSGADPADDRTLVVIKRKA